MAAGDIAIYREAAGNNATTTSVKELTWDTTIREDSIYTLNGATDRVDCSEAGHYLVLYNIAFEEPNPPPASPTRSEIQTKIYINGAANTGDYGASSAYLRNNAETGQVTGTCAGTILSLSANDDLSVTMQRTDTAGLAGACEQATDGTGGSRFSIIRMNDDWDYLRIRRTSDESASATSFATMEFTTNDEVDSGSFSHSTSTDPEEVTINADGTYLCFINAQYLNSSGSARLNALMRLELSINGGTSFAEIPGTRATAFARGTESCQHAVGNICCILNLEDGDILRVRYRHENSGAATGTPQGGTMAWTMVALPDTAEIFSIQEVLAGAQIQTVQDHSFDSVLVEDTASFDANPLAGSTFTEVEIQQEMFILAMMGWHANTNGTRNSSRLNTGFVWRKNGAFVGKTGEGGYGYKLGYNRGSPNSCEQSAVCQVALLDDFDTAGDDLEFRAVSPGNGGDTTVVFTAGVTVAAGLNLGTIFPEHESVDEDVEITEGAERALALNRARDETVEITEGAERSIGLHRARDETVEITEGAHAAMAFYRAVSEIVEITEEAEELLIAVGGALYRAVSEIVEISEGPVRTLAFNRAVSEIAEIFENASFMRGVHISEAVSVAETLNRAIWASFNEAIKIKEGPVRYWQIFRALDEGIDITEGRFAQLGFAVQVSEILEISEEVLAEAVLAAMYHFRADSAAGGSVASDSAMGGIADEDVALGGADAGDGAMGGQQAGDDGNG